MAERPCLYLQGSGSVPTNDGTDDRTLLAAILGGDPFGSLVPGIGAIGRGHGVLSGSALQVTENVTPDSNVRVGPGVASVRGTAGGQYGAYVCSLDATETLAIAAKSGTSGQDRKDLVVAQVKDNEFGVAGDAWTTAVVQGTTGSSPSDPTVPASSLVLARVNVLGGSGSTVITDADIDDLRPQARCVGGITPVAQASDFPNPQDFDVVWDESDASLKIRNNGVWRTVSINYDGEWIQFTPNWNGSVSIGNGVQYGRVWKMGRMVTGVAGFTRGSTSTQSGQIQMVPPYPIHVPNRNFARYLLGTRGYDSSGSGVWSAVGEINPQTQLFEHFTTAGLPIWDPTNPFTWSENDSFHILFNYESVAP